MSDVKSSGPALYLVATPIGNLEDITLRALRVLKEVDVIACEDTRQTQKLLNHYAISTRTTSYHEHNEMTKSAELVKEMQEGASVALVTDAGMPSTTQCQKPEPVGASGSKQVTAKLCITVASTFILRTMPP